VFVAVTDQPFGDWVVCRLILETMRERKPKQHKPKALITTRQRYAEKIAATWQKSIDSFLETGRQLRQAQHELPYGTFEEMVASDLPFDKRTAERLMLIAKHPVISDPAHAPLLPPSWMTLYELTKIDKKLGEGTLLAKIEDGTITPKTQRQDVTAILRNRPPMPKAEYTNAHGKYVKFLRSLLPEECRSELLRLGASVSHLDIGCTIAVNQLEKEEA
jgi:hypothetical protein